MGIYIVRHGKTLLNSFFKNQGWIDSKLTQEGIEELKNNFINLSLPKFDYVFLSDLGRVNETFEILSEYIKYDEEKVIILPELRERYLGSFEGDDLQKNRAYLTNKAGYDSFEHFIKERSFEDLINLTNEYDPLSLAEDFQTFQKRIDFAITKMKNEVGDVSNKNILIVSHQNTISLVIHILTNKSGEFNPLEVRNGEAIKLTLDGSWRIDDLFTNVNINKER